MNKINIDDMNIVGSIWSEKTWMAIAVPTWSEKASDKSKECDIS